MFCKRFTLQNMRADCTLTNEVYFKVSSQNPQVQPTENTLTITWSIDDFKTRCSSHFQNFPLKPDTVTFDILLKVSKLSSKAKGLKKFWSFRKSRTRF